MPDQPEALDLLGEFERTYLQRLLLAAGIILELGPDGAISDGLEVELTVFKEQVERVLLKGSVRQRL